MRSTRSRRGARQRGFTLVEMMTVIAIIGILAALMIGLSSRPYGANANVVSEQLVQTFNYARTRALMTRKIHRVELHLELDPVEVHVWQADRRGMAVANLGANGGPQFVERVRIPRSVDVWAAVAGAQASSGTDPAETTAQFDIDFLPNGATSGTGATIYLTDASRAREARVLVYPATGSSYARPTW